VSGKSYFIRTGTRLKVDLKEEWQTFNGVTFIQTRGLEIRKEGCSLEKKGKPRKAPKEGGSGSPTDPTKGKRLQPIRTERGVNRK